MVCGGPWQLIVTQHWSRHAMTDVPPASYLVMIHGHPLVTTFIPLGSESTVHLLER